MADEELLSLFRQSNLSERKFAKAFGLNFNSLHGRLYRAKKQEETGEKVEVKTEGNTQTVKVLSVRIKTLEDLIAHCGIDLDKWEIVRHRINKWEGYRREESKDLSFDSGIIDGWAKDTGKLRIEPLYQVEAVLVNKKPEPIKPVVTQVRISVEPKTYQQSKKTTKRALVIADPHFGFSRDLVSNKLTSYHDRKALSVVLQIASVFEFDKIIVTGDILDLAEWSDHFARSPEMRYVTQPAVIEAAWFLAQLKHFCDDIDLLEGNHDVRMTKLLVKHMDAAYGLKPAHKLESWPVMSIPNLLGLDEMGVNYIDGYPNCESWINDQIVCTHGNVASAKSGATVTKVIQDIQHTTIFGHIHRIENASKTVHGKDRSETIGAYSVGCTCKIDGTVPGSKSKNNWQQGLAIVSYTEDNHQIVTVPINNGKAIYDSSPWLGESYKSILNNEVEWEF